MSRDLSITWDFFATSHGKGSVDGVSGGVKRGVHQKVMSRQEVVKTAEDYSRVAAEVCPNVTILYITEDEIIVCRDLLDSLVFNGSKTLPGTRRMHHMEVVAPSEIKHSRFKGATIEKVHKFK